MEENKSLELLADNIIDLDEEINIVVQSAHKNMGQRPEKHMPPLTIREIEAHRFISGNVPGFAVMKTLNLGEIIKEDRYLSADTKFNFCADVRL